MFPELAASGDLTSVLGVLSAMITPAVLILATGSLIMTTSNRLTRVIDRVREMASEIESVVEPQPDEEPVAHRIEKRDLLFAQLERSTRRARLLQKSMTRLYLSLALFIATSVAIGVVALIRVNIGWIPLVFGFFGAALLFSASIHLIWESRIALATTYAEMDFITKNFGRR
jgi:anti-sigma-K factor RskA